jgi:hypothetical protein
MSRVFSARPTRRWVTLPLLFLAVLSLSGCIRAHAELTLSGNDLVSGQIRIATLAASDDDTGPTLIIPPPLSNRVTMSPYKADGYVGQTLILERLNFDEMRLLSETMSSFSSRYRLSFRRSGELVSLGGSVDLNQLPQDKADFQIKVTFPGSIMRANGELNGNAITWVPKPGGVTEFSATAQYSDVEAVSLGKWALIVGAGALGVSGLVALLALAAHRRDRRRTEPVATSAPF